MESLKNIYGKAKKKFSGEPAQEELRDLENSDEPETITDYDTLNEAVQPVTRSVSQFEKDFASTSSKASASHSHGLDSLFSPSTDENDETEDTTAPMSPVESLPVMESGGRVSAGNSQDYMTKPDVQVARSRQVAVIKPDTFEEAEIVTKTLKTGGLVLIDLRSTDDALAKRFLDFSFGATSALGGCVDVLENKIYSITTGNPITETELNRVKNERLI